MNANINNAIVKQYKKTLEEAKKYREVGFYTNGIAIQLSFNSINQVIKK